MTKNEYEQSKAEIIKQLGTPEYDMGDAVNESAKKLVELRRSYQHGIEEAKRNKKLANDIKTIAESVPQRHIGVPEEIVRQEWLVTFNEKQKRIINRWLVNIKQTPQELSDYLNISTLEVKSTLSLEAFQHLRSHLALAYKDLLPLEASAALRECLYSPTENVRFNAIKLILLDAGLYKGDVVEQPNKLEKVLDPETEEKLRKLGNQVLGL